MVRHGESQWNAQARIQGQGGAGLTARGGEQAQRTAAYLRRRYPDATVVARSDLDRVAETSAPFEQDFPGEVVVAEGLRELDFGSWSGLTWDEVERREPGARDAWASGPDRRWGGGESYGQLRARVWSALLELADHAESVVVFTHGGPIRVAVAAALDLAPLGERRLAPVGNCSVTELEIGAHGARLSAYNASDHL